jgi:hypothetical protein
MATNYEALVTELYRHLSRDKRQLTENDSYYDAEKRLTTIGIATPPEMRSLLVKVGWPRVYVDAIEHRLDVEGFRLAGQSDADEDLWDWWQANNMDVEAGIGHTEALVHGRAYVSVAAPDKTNPLFDPTVPVYRVESPMHMYVDIDRVTRMPSKALRITPNPDDAKRPRATLLLPNETVILDRRNGNTGPWEVVGEPIRHRLGVVPVVPILNRQRAAKREGKSEIFPELRSVTDAACRLFMNLAATAELMAVPQRLLFGVAAEAITANPSDPGSVLESYMARIIAVEDSDAHAFQWIAAELRNFVDGISELRVEAISTTGLPPSYYGSSSDNPASADAIRASENRLVKLAERKATYFGSAWEQVNRLGMLVMKRPLKSEHFRMETIWRNPATPTYEAKADAATKAYANGNGLIPKEQGRIDMGYSVETRKQMRKWDQESPIQQLGALYGAQGIPSLAEGAPAQAKAAPAKPPVVAKTKPPVPAKAS